MIYDKLGDMTDSMWEYLLTRFNERNKMTEINDSGDEVVDMDIEVSKELDLDENPIDLTKDDASNETIKEGSA